MLYQMEQRAVIAESQSTEIELKYTAVEQEAKQKNIALSNVTHELEFKKQKIAVLEARVGGTAMPDFPPARGSKLSEKDEVGGKMSKIKNTFRKNSFNDKKVTTSGTVEKKGFWANLLSKSNGTVEVEKDTSTTEMKEESEMSESELKKKNNSKEIRKAKIGDNGGSIIIRQEPEFPGSSAGALLSGGTEFEFISVIRKDVEIVVSTNGSNSSSTNLLLSGQLTKKISIAFYELKDGRGWIPDFNKNDPLIPLVRITSGIPEDEQFLLNNAKNKTSRSNSDGGSFKLKKSNSSMKSFKEEDEEDSLYQPKKASTPKSSSKLQSRLASSVELNSKSSRGGSVGSPRASISGNTRGRVSSTVTPTSANSKNKSKVKKEAPGPPPPPPGPQVLDIRFEECGDPTLGLVLCPTKFGLEVCIYIVFFFIFFSFSCV